MVGVGCLYIGGVLIYCIGVLGGRFIPTAFVVLEVLHVGVYVRVLGGGR